ncbi:ferredoxin reductase [Ochrobactrum quorumnocens]|uniref:ferredoxin--NADP(+) reductase n=1 Tax=Ochrobactrum quorumnocens TaxID=271865 RepID=A0A248UCM9_9HYPH|nr:ferredoxin--NADP reductase [[Ochrobactrum] quorumnocens]ASV84141.1 ferredoxin reductase [[Ochrobactrum] quorumnocens]
MTATSAIATSDLFPIPSGVHAERIVSVRHYTDRLFSFRTTRPQSFRFRSGEFVMIGLPNAQKPVFRAYSIASPAWDDELEFFSIKVEDGPLTQHLQNIREGDKILLRPKTTGTLVVDALLPGRRLWMLSTGTGIAPFASIIRDPATYEKFEHIILTHTCRKVAELTYGFDLARGLLSNPLTAEFAGDQFSHYTTTTREPYERMGRITERIWNESLFTDLAIKPFDPTNDRIMICGSIEMTRELGAFAELLGFREGSNNKPGEFVVERAFVG